MKYFKFTEPYLAVIKAKHIGEALCIYSRDIAEKESDRSPLAIDKYTALGLYIE